MRCHAVLPLLRDAFALLQSTPFSTLRATPCRHAAFMMPWPCFSAVIRYYASATYDADTLLPLADTYAQAMFAICLLIRCLMACRAASAVTDCHDDDDVMSPIFICR